MNILVQNDKESFKIENLTADDLIKLWQFRDTFKKSEKKNENTQKTEKINKESVAFIYKDKTNNGSISETERAEGMKQLSYLIKKINDESYDYEIALKNLIVYSHSFNTMIGKENRYGFPITVKGDEMFRIPILTYRDIFKDNKQIMDCIGDSYFIDMPHRAFVRSDKKRKLRFIPYIDIARYPASRNQNGEIVSVDTNSNNFITNVNFDQAREYCRDKGKGYHLMTNWEWSLVALLAKHIYGVDENDIKSVLSHNKSDNGIKYLWNRKYSCNWSWIDGFKQNENNRWVINPYNTIELNTRKK